MIKRKAFYFELINNTVTHTQRAVSRPVEIPMSAEVSNVLCLPTHIVAVLIEGHIDTACNKLVLVNTKHTSLHRKPSFYNNNSKYVFYIIEI